MTNEDESVSADEKRTSNDEIDRRGLLKTTGAGVLGLTGLRYTVGYASAEQETIEDWNDLNAIRNKLDNSNYTLVADLDADTPGYDEHVGDPDGGWEPIDDSDFGNSWSLDGDGHSIADLVIDRPDESEVGLFGEVTEGQIEDLSIRDADITAGDRVGTLIGTAETCTVINSDATGSVSGNGSVGGVIGSSLGGEITDSYSEQSVTGSNVAGGLVGNGDGLDVSNSYVTGPVSADEGAGGLIGRHIQTTITESYVTGSVSSDGSAGGLLNIGSTTEIERSFATGAVSGETAVGGLAAAGELISITESYATGSVAGKERVGGLVGGQIWDGSSISESYATGSVTGEKKVGGLAGEVGNYVTVRNSYATGSVDGTTKVGGLIGEALSGSVIASSYWDVPATGQDDTDEGDGYREPDVAPATGLGALDDEPPAEEMTGDDATENMDEFDFEDTWRVRTNPDDYPELQWVEESSPLADYTDEEGIIDTDGLRAAVGDWQADEIDTDLLREVVAAWRSGEPVG